MPKVNGNGYDFSGQDVPRAYPYVVNDIGRNTGFVNVGMDHGTAEFAENAFRGWWLHDGRALDPGTGQALDVTSRTPHGPRHRRTPASSRLGVLA